MEIIFDQLELSGQNPIILTEKLFEHYPHTEIQKFQKEIQKKLIMKNNQLKDIFSSRYQELLDCSLLVNRITDYTQQIMQNSFFFFNKQSSTKCLNLLQNPPVLNQKSVQVPKEKTFESYKKRLFKISKQIQKCSENYINVIAAKSLNTLITSTKDSECLYYLQLQEQDLKSSIRNFGILSVKQHELTSYLILDIIFANLFYFQTIEKFYEHFCDYLHKYPQNFQLIIQTRSVFNNICKQQPNLVQFFINFLQTPLRIKDIKERRLLKIRSFKDYEKMKGDTNLSEDEEAYLQQLNDDMINLWPGFLNKMIDILTSKLVQKDFDYELYEIILNQQYEEPLIFERLQVAWISFFQAQLSHSFHQLEFQHAIFQNIKGSCQSFASLLFDFREHWIEQITNWNKVQLEYLSHVTKSPNIYNLPQCKVLYGKQLDNFNNKFETLINQEESYDLNELGRLYMSVMIMVQEWNKVNSQVTKLDEDGICDQFKQHIERLHVSNEDLEKCIKQIDLSQLSQYKNILERFIGNFVQRDQIDMRFHNLANVINPQQLGQYYFDKFQTKKEKVQNTVKQPKQLMRKTIQIKVPEGGAMDYTIFPFLMTPGVQSRKQEDVKVDQQGLQMWQSKQQVVKQPQQTVPKTRFGIGLFDKWKTQQQ